MKRLRRMEIFVSGKGRIKFQKLLWKIFPIQALVDVDRKDDLFLKKYESDIATVIKSYQVRRKALFVGGKSIRIDMRDVQLIFGICDGMDTLEYKAKGNVMSGWVTRVFEDQLEVGSKKIPLANKLIYDKIVKLLCNTDNTSVQYVARLTVCYMLSSVNQNNICYMLD